LVYFAVWQVVVAVALVATLVLGARRAPGDRDRP
jgi:hypothetical protein